MRISPIHILLVGRPAKLLAVSTGNIKNAELEALFMANVPAIVAAFTTHDFVEITQHTIIIHA